MPPAVILTSNRTRDLHDALKRRCLYHWIDYPSREREVEIVRRRVPSSSEPLALAVAGAVRRLRGSDVQKPPGIAEAIDWVAALELLGVERLDPVAAERTLGSVLKYREDQDEIRARGLDWLVGRRCLRPSIPPCSPRRSATRCTTRACPAPPSAPCASPGRSRSRRRRRATSSTGRRA